MEPTLTPPAPLGGYCSRCDNAIHDTMGSWVDPQSGHRTCESCGPFGERSDD